MAQQSIPTIFIVDGNLKGTQQPSDCLHNLLCQTILDLTINHRQHPVRSFFIYTRQNLAISLMLKCRIDLIPVMIGFFHADNFIHGTIWSKQLLHLIGLDF